MKTKKIIYWVATSLLSLQLLIGVGFYFFNTSHAIEEFGNLGFPAYIVIPLGIAKLLAVITILTDRYKSLTEWAYAGVFFNLVLAFSAHLIAKDGEFIAALVALVFLSLSYCLRCECSKNK